MNDFQNSRISMTLIILFSHEVMVSNNLFDYRRVKKLLVRFQLITEVWQQLKYNCDLYNEVCHPESVKFYIQLNPS